LSPETSPPANDAPDAWLPYGRHWVNDDDIRAVVDVLRGDWLTTGPTIDRLERAFARRVGAAEAVAVGSGTAALHAAMFALDIGPGDEVIVPALTFVATANCIVYQGGTPVFADVDPDTLLLDADSVARRITPRTRAVIGVDYAGQPCDYDRLREVCRWNGLALVADACHALGGDDAGRPVGSLADLSAFSLHPVKPITAGEGGLVATDDPRLAARMRSFRNHGIDTSARQREASGTWAYRMTDLGHNHRLSDLHAALALSQLGRLDDWTARRRQIAARYDAALADLPGLRPLATRPGVGHARHLYVVGVNELLARRSRDELFGALRSRGVGVNVHYPPVHLHPYYQRRYGTRPGLCPVAEEAGERILSLPIFPRMRDGDVDRVVDALRELVGVSGLAAAA
jgi:perosamine synthetase